ncbi:FAR-17a/AIG1-like protein [Pisolithus sp. B1]|nr:FAR-17a/AIG1-like protein [Pisolithus sp. B1]KAI6103424.1 FAR-17a/AIG1-like protein [Pisolithus sp. B1]
MQKTSSARPLALHTAAASIMAYAWSKVGSLPFDDLISKQKGGHLQFLTIQALVGAWAYMGLCLVWDIFPGVRQLGLVRFVKRMLLMVALPLAFVVTSIYWSLYLFFPTLILRPENSFAGAQDSPSLVPKLLRPPLHVDVAMHVAPFATVLVDFLVFERKLSPWQLNKSAPITLLLYGILYACWVEYCSFYNGVFPYPFLTINPPEGRAVVYACVTALAFIALRLLNHLHA